MSYDVRVVFASAVPLATFERLAGYLGLTPNGSKGDFVYDAFEAAGVFFSLDVKKSWIGRIGEVHANLCFGGPPESGSRLAKVVKWLAQAYDGEIQDPQIAGPIERRKAAKAIYAKWAEANLWALSTHEAGKYLVHTPHNIFTGPDGRRTMAEGVGFPDPVTCLLTVATGYARVEAFDRAFAVAQKGLEVHPGDRGLRRNAAMSLWFLGRRPEARRALAGLIAEDPGDEPVRGLRDALEQEAADEGEWNPAQAKMIAEALASLSAALAKIEPGVQRIDFLEPFNRLRGPSVAAARLLRKLARLFTGAGKPVPRDLEAALARSQELDASFDLLEQKHVDAVIQALRR